MWLTTVALLAALFGQDGATERGTIVRTFDPPPRGVRRCLRDLPSNERHAIQITCEVNSIARPTRCEFDPETPREIRYATECVSRGYEFRWQDGRPATGEQVRFTVHLVMP